LREYRPSLDGEEEWRTVSSCWRQAHETFTSVLVTRANCISLVRLTVNACLRAANFVRVQPTLGT